MLLQCCLQQKQPGCDTSATANALRRVHREPFVPQLRVPSPAVVYNVLLFVSRYSTLAMTPLCARRYGEPVAWRRNDAQGVWDCFPDYVAALADSVACAKPAAAAVQASLQLADSLQASVSAALEEANNGEGIAAGSQLLPGEVVSMRRYP